jgi:hypothetical protein
MAHFLGLCAKQEDDRRKNSLLAIGMLLVTLCAIYGINYSRTGYLTENGSKMASRAATQWAYYSINLLVFVFAVGLSFFAHERHSLLAALKQWEARYQVTLQRISAALARRSMVLAHSRAFVGEISDGSRMLCLIYQRAYARNRRDDPIPSYFSKPEVLVTSEPGPSKPNKKDGAFQGDFCWWLVPEFETSCDEIVASARRELASESRNEARLTDSTTARLGADALNVNRSPGNSPSVASLGGASANPRLAK